MLDTKNISIILPTFNEKKNIISIIESLLSLPISNRLELIVVDDNSLDGTAEIVKEYAQKERRLKIIKRLGRCGLSSAIKEGCLCAFGDIIAIMDTDGQHEVKTTYEAIKKLSKENLDIVIGSRFHPESVINGLNKKRKNASSIANSLARKSLPDKYKHLTDYMSGCMVLNSKRCMPIIEKIDVNGFKFLYEVLSISRGSLKVKEVPLIFQDRLYGTSKLNLFVIWDFLISLIHTSFKRVFPRRAISFGIIGSFGILVQMFILYFLLWSTSFSFEKVLPIAVVCAATSNYTINNFLTFRINRLVKIRFFVGLLKFLLVSSLPIIANVGLASLFYSQISPNTFLSQIAGIVVVFIWNYAASSKVVWNL